MEESQIIKKLKDGFVSSMDYGDMVDFLNMEDEIASQVEEKIDELFESTGMEGVVKALTWAGFETKTYLAHEGIFL